MDLVIAPFMEGDIQNWQDYINKNSANLSVKPKKYYIRDEGNNSGALVSVDYDIES